MNKVYIAMTCHEYEGCGSFHVFDSKAKAKDFIKMKEDEEKAYILESIKRDQERLDNWQKYWNLESDSMRQVYDNDPKKYKHSIKDMIDWQEERLETGEYSDWCWKQYEVL